MMIFSTFEADGINFVVPVEMGLGAPATLEGASVFVDAVDLVSGVKSAGVATLAGPKTINCYFPAWSKPAGEYDIQVRVDLPGHSTKTVARAKCRVERSAVARPDEA